MTKLIFDCVHEYREGSRSGAGSGFRLEAAFESDAPVTAIRGPSGCGKSTLLALVAGLLRPSQGTIQFGGKTLVDVQKKQWLPPERRAIGYLFQDQRLFPHLTVRGNLSFPRRRWRAIQKGGAHAPARNGEFLERVVEALELGPYLARYPRSLSGGQQQRVALARALLREPELLLLDEPWQGLDAELRERSQELVERAVAVTRAPILFVSHHDDEPPHFAQKIVTLRGGRIVGNAASD